MSDESMDYDDFVEQFNDDDDDDNEEESDADYEDMFDDQFDGFLKHNAQTDVDLNHEQIMNFLRLGIDPKRSAQFGKELLTMVEAGPAEPVAAGVVEFVCQCPPSNVELVQRFQSIQALVKIWKDFGKYVTTAINDILDPEKPALNRIPSRNLTNFIRVLVDENIIDSKELIIAKSRDSTLPDLYIERLHQVLYSHYGHGNPRLNKAATVAEDAGKMMSQVMSSTAAAAALPGKTMSQIMSSTATKIQDLFSYKGGTSSFAQGSTKEAPVEVNLPSIDDKNDANPGDSSESTTLAKNVPNGGGDAS